MVCLDEAQSSATGGYGIHSWPLPAQRIDPDRKDDDGADDDLLRECLDGEKIEPVDHESDHQHAEHGARHAALATKHASAANDYRTDRLQKDIAGAEQRLTGDHPSAHQKAGNGCAAAADQKDQYLDLIDLDAGHHGNGFAAPDRVNVTAKPCPRQNDMRGGDQQNRYEHRYWDRPYEAASEPKEIINVGLRQTENGRAAGIDHGETRSHVERTERHDERLDPRATDQ